MKFMVMVNQKYLVMVEANTNGGAEHKILDNIYYGIETCQAFKLDELSTDFFRSCAENCETISYSELVDKAKNYKEIFDAIEKEKAEKEECQKQIEEMKRAIKVAEEKCTVCAHNLNTLQHKLCF